MRTGRSHGWTGRQRPDGSSRFRVQLVAVPSHVPHNETATPLTRHCVMHAHCLHHCIQSGHRSDRMTLRSAALVLLGIAGLIGALACSGGRFHGRGSVGLPGRTAGRPSGACARRREHSDCLRTPAPSSRPIDLVDGATLATIRPSSSTTVRVCGTVVNNGHTVQVNVGPGQRHHPRRQGATSCCSCHFRTTGNRLQAKAHVYGMRLQSCSSGVFAPGAPHATASALANGLSVLLDEGVLPRR